MRVSLDQLALTPGDKLADLFDFGDEWRVRLRLIEIQPGERRSIPPILESRGEPPPQ